MKLKQPKDYIDSIAATTERINHFHSMAYVSSKAGTNPGSIQKTVQATVENSLRLDRLDTNKKAA